MARAYRLGDITSAVRTPTFEDERAVKLALGKIVQPERALASDAEDVTDGLLSHFLGEL